MTDRLDRRSALQGLAVMAASAVVPQAWAGMSPAQTAPAAAPLPRLLIDTRLASHEWRGLGALEHRGSPVPLEAELVRQWRRGLWAQLRASGGGPVRALVRWDHALLLQGLAREERCQATVTQCGPALFEVRFSA